MVWVNLKMIEKQLLCFEKTKNQLILVYMSDDFEN